MKKQTLLFTFSLFFSMQTKAQTSVYHPFPDSNVVWTGTHQWTTGTIYEEDYQEFIKGDTTIGSNVYRNIYESGLFIQYDQQYPMVDTSYYYFDRYVGSFRQNSTKQVFFYPDEGNNESLLYDFNLSLGDTLKNSYINDSALEHTYVSQIDSISDGLNYWKRYYLSADYNFHNYASLIEGIGSTFGVTFSLEPAGENDGRLDCFMYNDTIRYSDGLAQNCNLSVGIKEQIQVSNNALYPNPATNQLTIQLSSLSNNEVANIFIFNVLGQETSPPAPLLEEGGVASIDVSALPQGVYFVEVVGEKERWVGRFLKE